MKNTTLPHPYNNLISNSPQKRKLSQTVFNKRYSQSSDELKKGLPDLEQKSSKLNSTVNKFKTQMRSQSQQQLNIQTQERHLKQIVQLKTEYQTSTSFQKSLAKIEQELETLPSYMRFQDPLILKKYKKQNQKIVMMEKGFQTQQGRFRPVSLQADPYREQIYTLKSEKTKTDNVSTQSSQVSAKDLNSNRTDRSQQSEAQLVLKTTELEIKNIQKQLQKVVAQDGEQTQDEAIRNQICWVVLRPKSSIIYRVTLKPMLCPLILQFMYPKQKKGIKLNQFDLVVNICKDQQGTHVIETYERPHQIEYNQSKGKKIFENFQYLFVQLVSGVQEHEFQMIAKFPKQDDFDRHQAYLEQERAKDPNYDEKVLEEQLKKKIPQLIKYKVNTYLENIQKWQEFKQLVDKIKSRKSVQMDFTTINKTRAIEWNQTSPTLKKQLSQKNENNQKLAEFRRQSLEIIKRKQSCFQTIKWDLIRSRKEEMMSVLNNLKICSKRQRQFKILFVLLNAFKIVGAGVNKFKQKTQRLMKEMYLSIKIKITLRRILKKFGKTFDIRLQRKLVQSLVFSQHLMSEVSRSQSQNIVLGYMREYEEIVELQSKFKQYFSSITKIKSAYRSYRARQQIRIKYIQYIFENKIKQTIDLLVKEKKKKLHLVQDVDIFVKIQHSDMSSRIAQQVYKLKEKDFMLKLMFMKLETVKTQDLIKINARIKQYSSDIVQMCYDMGLCPAGTPLKKLPFGYAKQLIGLKPCFNTSPKSQEVVLIMGSQVSMVRYQMEAELAEQEAKTRKLNKQKTIKQKQI